MKIKNIITVLLIALILASCTPSAKVAPTETAFPTLTSAPSPTRTPSITATSTAIPVYTDISCEPSENPYAVIPDEFWYEKPYLPNIPISKICTFKGKISRGQFYIHKIQEDVLFCLIPAVPDILDNGSGGWFIRITDNCDIPITNHLDFAAPVNPPFRGNTSSEILGWRFRNEDNTENINRGYKRRMTFVFNSEDAETAYASVACSLWGFDTDCARAKETNANIVERTEGIFSITKLELGNLVPNSHAWIDFMEFEFAFYLLLGTNQHRRNHNLKVAPTEPKKTNLCFVFKFYQNGSVLKED